MSPSIVLHPEQPEGIAEFLSKIRDVRLLKPQDENEVLECLGSGAEILVTFRWRDEYLLSSLEWIASTSAGYEQYPIRQLQSQGVKVTTASVNAGVKLGHGAAQNWATLGWRWRRAVGGGQSAALSM